MNFYTSKDIGEKWGCIDIVFVLQYQYNKERTQKTWIKFK